MDGFYEWKVKAKKNSHTGSLQKIREVFCCAGLFDTWKAPDGRVVHSYTIITLPANEFMQQLHDRMPAMLSPETEKLWLDPAMSKKDVLDLLVPYDSDKMDAYAVSKKVGNVRNGGRPY